MILAQLFVVLLTLSNTQNVLFDWYLFSIVTLYVQWVCLSSAGILCLGRHLLARMSNRTAGVVALVFCSGNGLLVSALGQGMVYGFDQVNPVLVARHTLITCLVAGLVLRYFYVQQQLIEQSKAELKARLQALHSRIRPHFLFNSMNIIASLIPTRPQEAEKAVEDLSDLFRASLHQSDELTTLEEEINLCQRFMYIEQLRIGDRLKVSWDIQADTNAWKIPQLSLQPLLENAVVHGIQKLQSGGTIIIKIYESDATLKITILNPKPPFVSKDTSKGNRVALENIENRMKSIYGEGARLSKHVTDDEFVCILSLPKIKK